MKWRFFRRPLAIAMCLICPLCVAAAAGAWTSTVAAGQGGWPEAELGTIRFVLESEILNEDRTLLVRLPEGYGSGERRYPVLYVLDGEWHFNIAAADLELLSECSYTNPHPVPRMIVVGLVNSDRNRDYTPTHCPEHRGMRFPSSGGAEAFRRFLLEEAVPAVEQRYRTEPFRVLAGWSLGGLFTIDTLMEGSAGFNAYLAVSPSLWWDGGLMSKSLETDPPRFDTSRKRKLIVTLGTAEAGGMVATTTDEFLEKLKLDPLPGLDAEFISIEGLGHNYSPKMAFFYGLATIFDDWNLPPEAVAGGLSRAETHYASLSRAYGFPIPVPEDAFSKIGWSHFEREEREECRAVFLEWVGRYPNSSLALASLGAFHREMGEVKQALAMIRIAVGLEKNSRAPRLSFLRDLERDLAALREGS